MPIFSCLYFVFWNYVTEMNSSLVSNRVNFK